MSDVDFISTEDVDWATGEDVDFEGARSMTTSRFVFLFDNSDRLLKLDNGDREFLFDNEARLLKPA